MDQIDERTLGYARNVIARLSGASQPAAERYFILKLNAGKRPSSLYNIAKALQHLDRALSGRPVAAVRVEDLLRLVARLREFQKGESLHQNCVLIRAFLKWVLQVDQDLPRPMREALTVKRPPLVSSRKPTTKAECDALLDQSAKDLRDPSRLRFQTILRTLRDSGMRASELLSLNVGSVELTGDGGAYLAMPTNASRLKTGPRRPHVVECVPILTAWLGQHPTPKDVDAPLFPAERAHGGSKRTTYNALLLQFRRLSKAAGLRPITPHLFRHAKATEMARNKWTNALATKQMGWAPGSKQWDAYVHLVDDDLVAQVRRDAGLDDAGRSKPKPETAEAPTSSEADKALDARLRKALRKLLLGDDH